MVNVFSVQVFFLIFRETLEASIIISVLLSFLNHGFLNGIQNQPHSNFIVGNPYSNSNVDLDLGEVEDIETESMIERRKKIHTRLFWQVWCGALIGIVICVIIGGIFIGVFYALGKDLWAKSEDLWEGIFSIIASVMITVMGVAMLRLNKMKEKWRMKLAAALFDPEEEDEFDTDSEPMHMSFFQRIIKSWADFKKQFQFKQFTKKYAMAILPFITTLREGLEAVIFLGGVSLGTPASAFPIPVICGIASGSAVGYAIYRGGNAMSIQIFLVCSTCFLYLISAGLFSRAVWFFEMHSFALKVGGDVAETGSGPGSYNIMKSVWHVNCCNPERDGGWDVFNAIFGWQNSATYGSVLAYNFYWIFIITLFMTMLCVEKIGMEFNLKTIWFLIKYSVFRVFRFFYLMFRKITNFKKPQGNEGQLQENSEVSEDKNRVKITEAAASSGEAIIENVELMHVRSHNVNPIVVTKETSEAS